MDKKTYLLSEIAKGVIAINSSLQGAIAGASLYFIGFSPITCFFAGCALSLTVSAFQMHKLGKELTETDE